jgi:hypothetical protein
VYVTTVELTAAKDSGGEVIGTLVMPKVTKKAPVPLFQGVEPEAPLREADLVEYDRQESLAEVFERSMGEIAWPIVIASPSLPVPS